jgi:hypothetical protein
MKAVAANHQLVRAKLRVQRRGRSGADSFTISRIALVQFDRPTSAFSHPDVEHLDSD